MPGILSLDWPRTRFRSQSHPCVTRYHSAPKNRARFKKEKKYSSKRGMCARVEPRVCTASMLPIHSRLLRAKPEEEPATTCSYDIDESVVSGGAKLITPNRVRMTIQNRRRGTVFCMICMQVWLCIKTSTNHELCAFIARVP